VERGRPDCESASDRLEKLAVEAETILTAPWPSGIRRGLQSRVPRFDSGRRLLVLVILQALAAVAARWLQRHLCGASSGTRWPPRTMGTAWRRA
jgi:hypothetical protein